jgi:hypothetical protein
VCFRLINIVFAFFPGLGDVTTGFASALQTVIASALAWNWIFPVIESLQLVVRAIQFEFAILLLWFGKWVVEFIRGK